MSKGLVAGCGSSPARPAAPVALTIPALDGGDIDTLRYRGQVVVIHFFTTWSLAAQRDVPQLVELHDTKSDQVVVLGVALDVDGYRLVAPWRAANGVGYLIGVAPAEMRAGRSPLGKIIEVPTTIVLDRAGRVVHRVQRALRDGELQRLVQPVVRR